MAEYGKKWPAMTSMALRNEPREPTNSDGARSRRTYNWENWYTFIRQGTEAIRSANTDVLIYLSGLSYDTYLTPIVRGQALDPGTKKFSFADFPGYANKLVLELHKYSGNEKTCNDLQTALYNSGFQALSASAANKFPVQMTEFGRLNNPKPEVSVFV
jgi:hypothetical protein